MASAINEVITIDGTLKYSGPYKKGGPNASIVLQDISDNRGNLGGDGQVDIVRIYNPPENLESGKNPPHSAYRAHARTTDSKAYVHQARVKLGLWNKLRTYRFFDQDRPLGAFAEEEFIREVEDELLEDPLSKGAKSFFETHQKPYARNLEKALNIMGKVQAAFENKSSIESYSLEDLGISEKDKGKLSVKLSNEDIVYRIEGTKAILKLSPDRDQVVSMVLIGSKGLVVVLEESEQLAFPSVYNEEAKSTLEAGLVYYQKPKAGDSTP